MKKAALIGLLFLVLVIGAIVYSTMSLAAHRIEVCMEFHGAVSCRTAKAATREAALRRAISNACAMIASGVTDSLACERSDPQKVNEIK